MEKNILAALLIICGITFIHTNASAWNTQIGLVILGSGETLSGSTSWYFPPVTWSNASGSTNTWTVHNTGNNSWGGWAGWNVGTPSVPILPIPNLGTTWIVDVIPPTTWTILTWPVLWLDTWNVWTPTTVVPIIDQEVLSAYNWSKQYGITTITTPEKARLDQPLLRSELAKMMVNFSVEVMWKFVTPHRSCTVDSFKDAYQMDAEERKYIKQACDLQIMWWKNDKKSIIEYFNPHKVVTRAEFGTVLSRFLYGEANNGDVTENWWYKAHLAALNHDSIMKKIDQPYLNEIRWYVMIMLQRVYK